ncbi:hypothetical protein [Sediminibacterium soli]|uniref:hypothetical protein n=1 Tax=Sediminibacterium soli TaxID=2698829 RepID=UPI00137A6F93|nr:hypothetical protein [Sediminibacterium soli]NCI45750.1 hypothetical protein [Sediminibacterium soli]
MKSLFINNKRRIAILSAAVILLLIPVTAMQLTDQVNWSASDFTIAGILLLCIGLACEWALRSMRNPKYQWVVCAALLAVLLLVWAELAVGVFGTPLAGS